jgi:acylphosphatase
VPRHGYGFIVACDSAARRPDAGWGWGKLPYQSEIMSRCRLRVLYSGRVQGVGFRYTVKSLTPGFEVSGIVRNLADGRVELIAEGEKEELLAFQQAIRDSGLGRLVDHEKVSWSETTGEFRGFAIVS